MGTARPNALLQFREAPPSDPKRRAPRPTLSPDSGHRPILSQRVHKSDSREGAVAVRAMKCIAEPADALPCLDKSGLVGSATEQLASRCPIGIRHVLEDNVDVVGISTGVLDDAFGNFGSNGFFSGVFFTFEPADTYYRHGIFLLDGVRNKQGRKRRLRFGELKDTSELVARPLMRQRWVICAAPSYLTRAGEPQDLPDLANHHCIVGHRRGQPLSWRVRLEEETVRYAPPLTHQIGDGEVMITGAVAGIGLCQMPHSLLREDIDAGRLVEVLQEFEPEPVDVHAVWPKVSHLRPKVRYVVDELVKLCQG